MIVVLLIQVSEITLDYTDCDTLQAASSNTSVTSFTNMPSFSYRLRSSDAHIQFNPPRYAFVNDSTADIGFQQQCIIQFEVPAELKHTVLLYYKLTNFYQNHRRYVKSMDTDQLKGKAVDFGTIKGGDCKPLDVITETQQIYWPCGLIANSLFNGWFHLRLWRVAFSTLDCFRYVQ